jgi:hypothetical protein
MEVSRSRERVDLWTEHYLPSSAAASRPVVVAASAEVA